MCRLFGMSGGAQPIRATFWLLQAPDSLRKQSLREPDGTGIGYFDAAGAPHVDKQPIAATHDPAFARAAREVRSTTFVAHVRFASTGDLQVRNTHPFEQHGRLFAHNGVIEGLDLLEAHLGEARSLVQGDTDSERFFALLTREIDSHEGDVRQGIDAATTWVADNLPVFSLNFVLATGTDLWALRFPDTHGLFVLERPAGGAAGEAMEHISALGTHVHSDEAGGRPVVVVASEPMDSDPGWRELESGELLHVPATLEVDTQIILERPPTHPLTLTDLHPQARSSQA